MKARVVLHEFKMGDVEDIEIYVAQPIYEWQQTPEGKWAMEHAEDITWQIYTDPGFYQRIIRITGILEDKYATYYTLKNS